MVFNKGCWLNKNKQINIVSAVLCDGERFLFMHRQNTQEYDGYWAFPVGHVENKENDIDALRRELFEELTIQMLDSEYITTLYDNQNNIKHSVFQVNSWRGDVNNNEPHLCASVKWFSLQNLPSPLTPATQNILNVYRETRIL